MRIKTTRIDLSRTKANWPADTQFQPALVIPRKSDKQKWMIVDAPIQEGCLLSWSSCDSDNYIRIPLFQYQLPAKGDLALAFAFRLGLACANQIEYPAEALHIVTGDPVELIADKTGEISEMRYWLGFGIAVE